MGLELCMPRSSDSAQINYFYNINPYLKSSTRNLLRQYWHYFTLYDQRGQLWFRIEDLERGRMWLHYIPPALAPVQVNPANNPNAPLEPRRPLVYRNQERYFVTPQSIKSNDRIHKNRNKPSIKHGRAISRWL